MSCSTCLCIQTKTWPKQLPQLLTAICGTCQKTRLPLHSLMRKYPMRKRLVVAALRQNVGSEDPLKRIYPSKKPHSLTTSSLQFFKILKLDEPSLTLTRASGTTWNSILLQTESRYLPLSKSCK